jgi:hypothetical protein
MLKKVLLAATVCGLVAGFALPVPSAEAAAMAPLTCKEAAKLKFPTDHKTRHAYKHEQGGLEGTKEGRQSLNQQKKIEISPRKGPGFGSLSHLSQLVRCFYSN